MWCHKAMCRILCYSVIRDCLQQVANAIASVQGDLATRHDLEAVEQKLTDKIEGVESNFNSKIGALDNKIDGVRGEMRWVFGGFFALHLLTLTAVIGPMVASLFAGS